VFGATVNRPGPLESTPASFRLEHVVVADICKHRYS